MRYRNHGILWPTAVALCLAVSGASAQTINEIRIDHESTDADEYFELRGTPSSSLTGLTYVVIGDGAGGCGTVEEVVSLAGKSIQADGYFVLGQAVPIGAQNFTYDALDTLTFENTDNLTHLLVTGWSGTLAQDLDTNNDGVLDVTPWTSIVDDVALLRVALPACGAPTVNDEPVYSADTVGPDGSFVPGHVWRCTDSGAWMIGPFNRVGGQDTPGAANTNCAAPPPSILEEERNVCAPLANQSVTVTDSISNATSATLTYSINGGAGVNVNMSSIGSNEWQAVIPGQAVNGTRVSYSVTANNASGSDVGFAQGYFVGFVDIEDVRAVDGTGVTLYRFYGVNLQGNVTAAQGTFSTVNTDFWFQDGTGGIRAFAFGPPVIASPALGDEVEVSGVLNQFNGLLEVESSTVCGPMTVQINGPGAVPAPRLVNTCELGEDTEGLLVKLQYPFVDTTGATTGGNWNGNDSSDLSNCEGASDLLFIDADTNIDTTPVQSIQIEVTGLSGQFDTVIPPLSSYQVVPRSLSDIMYLTPSGTIDGAVNAKPRLFQSTPNPFSKQTTISYEIPSAGRPDATANVTINLFDIAGRKVATLVDGTKAAGVYNVTVDADALGGLRSGIFFYTFEVDGVTVATQKLVLSR